jgi:cell wall-associated NlpC family hydrolase
MAMTRTMMHPRTPRSITLSTLLLALALAPLHALGAQEGGLIEAYASRLRPTNTPVLGGLSLSGYSGPFGLRLSGAINLRDDGLSSYDQQSAACRRRYFCPPPTYDGSLGPTLGAWAYDADLIFAPFRTIAPLRALVLGFSPYAFVGIGRSAITPKDAADTVRTTVSYGLGAYRSLFERLGVSAEARYRRPVQGDSTLTVGMGQEWEYRLGLSIRLGGDPQPAAQTVAATVPIDTDVVAARRAEEAAMIEESRARSTSHILDAAEELIGTRYEHGGTAPATGFDAAGFVQHLFKGEGVSLPGTAREIAKRGTEVQLRENALEPGDLLFFANDGENVDHVGMYVGHDRFVHASESGEGVRYEVFGQGARGRWYFDHLVSARRVLDGRPSKLSVPFDDGRDPGDRAPRPRPSPESEE